MKCPYCATDNRDDRESCYHCGKDISMLRLIVNKARHHYNTALEHAERQRYVEALAELQHALDLDHSFVPAHVVMGTVYARMERYGEAERCWKTALSLDPHILKAHEYISKADLAQSATPLLRRLRWAIAAAVAVVIVFCLLALWSLRPSPDRRELRRAIAQMDKAQHGGAIQTLERLQATARSGDVRQAARLGLKAIALKYESAATGMLTLVLQNRPIEARRLYKNLLEGEAIPDRYRQYLETLDEAATSQALALLEAWLHQYEQQAVSYEEFLARVGALRDIFDEGAAAGRLDDIVRSGRILMASRAVEAIPASPASTSETLTWLATLERLAKEVPEAQDMITSAAQQLLTAAIERSQAQMDKVTAAGDAAALDSLLDDLNRLAAYAPADPFSQLVEKALQRQREIKGKQLIAQLEKATIENIPAVEKWIAEYEQQTSTTIAGDTETTEAVRRSLRRLALEMLRWCTERDQRFELGRISEEEARFAVERTDFVLRHIAASNWRYVRDNTMFYSAIAWLQLGQREKARAWLERLENEFPKSPYVEISRRLRKQVEPAAEKESEEKPQ